MGGWVGGTRGKGRGGFEGRRKIDHAFDLVGATLSQASNPATASHFSMLERRRKKASIMRILPNLTSSSAWTMATLQKAPGPESVDGSVRPSRAGCAG